MSTKKTIAVDFDGVIHQYDGWRDGSIYGEPIAGSFDAMMKMIHNGFNVVVFSARPADQIRPWLIEKWPFKMFPVPEVTNQKPIAIAYIDDRAVPFTNNWPEILEKFPFQSK
jgi:hypothetical protein